MKLTFETAAIADAIKKAEKVAPSTAGQAFDKAAGIMIEASTEMCVVKATNLDIYLMEWVTPQEGEGEPIRWRLPSRSLASVITSLPIGSGKTVVLEDKVNGLQKQVHLSAGRVRARFNLLDATYFPTWSAFDPALLTPAMDVGGRIAQVEWAAAKSETPLCGVNLTGTVAQATDRYRLARAPLMIPGLDKSVTVPSGVLSQLLKQTGEISIGYNGDQLLIMPDEFSQIRAILYGQPYPSLDKPLSRVFSNKITLRKSEIIPMLQRAANFADDRDPFLTLFIGAEEIAVMMQNDETGLLGDAIVITGQATHERYECRFTPKNIIDPIERCPSDEVEFGYNFDKPNDPVRIDGGSGYFAIAMPRQKEKAAQ